ncbi:MAG: tetratricopeptide (TPR) repeat protein [Flavobacteriales bacterium]|jgi:tetratricopeptide (TPR) repeat protein
MKTTLTLCMILRDEAELLPRFIQAVDGLWDEWIAVDTGSVDTTVSLLKAAGARVVHHPWSGDFAEARNVGLQKATGDWILVLDADEFVSHSSIKEIRHTIEDARIGAATLPIRNPLPHGHVRVAPLLRLFRNSPSIWFRYPIHEDVGESVSTMLNQTGTQLVALHEPVEHVGYIRDRAVAKDKKVRDATILRRCIKDTPSDAYNYFKLLSLGVFWDDKTLKSEAATAVDAQLRKRGATWLTGLHFAGELLAMLARTLFPADPNAAATYLEGWRDAGEGSCEFHYALGSLLETAGHPTRAAAQFDACLEPTSKTQNAQMARVRPLLGLARLAIRRGDLPEAQTHTEEALSAQPRDPEALLSSALLWRASHPHSAWDTYVDSYTGRFPACSELFETLAELAIGDAKPAIAERYLTQRCVDQSSAGVRYRAAQVALLQGDVADCRERCMALMESDARAGLGVLVCDLIMVESTELSLALSAEEANRAMREWSSLATRSAKSRIREAFAQNAPLAAGTFPWLGTLQRAAA